MMCEYCNGCIKLGTVNMTYSDVYRCDGKPIMQCTNKFRKPLVEKPEWCPSKIKESEVTENE